jgi:hypothetical protein
VKKAPSQAWAPKRAQTVRKAHSQTPWGQCLAPAARRAHTQRSKARAFVVYAPLYHCAGQINTETDVLELAKGRAPHVPLVVSTSTGRPALAQMQEHVPTALRVPRATIGQPHALARMLEYVRPAHHALRANTELAVLAQTRGCVKIVRPVMRAATGPPPAAAQTLEPVKSVSARRLTMRPIAEVTRRAHASRWCQSPLANGAKNHTRGPHF